MPVGGKINRRDHLRSKVTSNNTKSNSEEKSPKKEVTKNNNPGFRYLEQLKERNAIKKGASKKDAHEYADGEKSKNTKGAIERISPTKISAEDEISGKSALKKTSTIRSTRMKKNVAPQIDEVILNAMEVDRDVKSVTKDDSLVIKSTLKKSSTIRSTKEKKNTTALFVEPILQVNLGMECVVKEDLSVDISSLKKNISQRKIRDRTDIVGSPPKVISPLRDVYTKVRETPTKSRIPKNIIMSEINKPEVSKNPRKTINKKADKAAVEEIIIEKVSPVNTPRTKSTPSKSRIQRSNSILERIYAVPESDNITIPMEVDEIVEVMTPAPKKVGRPSTRIVKNAVPFVVEMDDKTETKKGEEKIPGREMLENLKKRKSQLLTHTEVENVAAKIPELEVTEEIRRRRSNAIAPTVTDEQATSKIIEGYSKVLESTTIPTPKSTTETRKRISQIVSLPIVTMSEMKSKTEIIPGLTTTAEIRRRKSAVESQSHVVTSEGDMDSKVDEKPVLLKKHLPQGKKITFDSPKIPGFSLIEEMRSRKSALLTPKKSEPPVTLSDCQAIPILTRPSIAVAPSSPFCARTQIQNYPQSTLSRVDTSIATKPYFSGYSPAPTRPSTYITATPTVSDDTATSRPLLSSTEYKPSVQPRMVVNSPFTSSVRPSIIVHESPRPSSTQPPSIFRTPTSSLARTTTHKRPISCLSDDEDTCASIEPKGKLAKTEERVARRQSVTFNNQVEVKEIKGNSFNDESGDMETSDNTDLSALERKVRHDLERTKSDLANKRMAQSHNLFSQGNMPATSTPSFKSRPFSASAATPRTSELSSYLTQKRRAQADVSGGPVAPVGYNFTNQPPSSSFTSDHLRFSAQSTAEQNRSHIAPSDSNDSLTNDISDDEMDDEQRNKNYKCSIM